MTDPTNKPRRIQTDEDLDALLRWAHEADLAALDKTIDLDKELMKLHLRAILEPPGI